MNWIHLNTVDSRTRTPLGLMSWRIYQQILKGKPFTNPIEFINLCGRVNDHITQQLRELTEDNFSPPLNYRVSLGSEIEVVNNGLQRTGLFSLEDYIELKRLQNQHKTTGSASLDLMESAMDKLTLTYYQQIKQAVQEYQQDTKYLDSLQVGKGLDGTHEFANYPVADYRLLIWEISELEQLGFLSLHPQILQWIGERGIHITISGEKGISLDENSILLQNSLLGTGYAATPLNGQGGIQDVEEKELANTVTVSGKELTINYSISRGMFIRERPGVPDIFTQKYVNNVEFRVNSLSSLTNLEKTFKAYNRLSIPLMTYQRYKSLINEKQLLQNINDFIDDPSLIETILADDYNGFLLPEIQNPLDRKLILIWAYYRVKSIYGFEKYQRSGILPSPLNKPSSKQLILMEAELGQIFPTTEEGSSRLLEDAYASYHNPPPKNTLPWFMQNLVNETISAVERSFKNISTTTSPDFIQQLTALGKSLAEPIQQFIETQTSQTSYLD